MRKQHIAQIKIPPLTAHEKKMWKEYVQARQAKSPQAALKAWARKHHVKLKSKNRVEMVHAYRGANAPAPLSNTAGTAQNCSQICGIKSFDRWWKVGTSTMRIICDFDTCEYDKKRRMWICWYQCTMAIFNP